MSLDYYYDVRKDFETSGKIQEYYFRQGYRWGGSHNTTFFEGVEFINIDKKTKCLWADNPYGTSRIRKEFLFVPPELFEI